MLIHLLADIFQSLSIFITAVVSTRALCLSLELLEGIALSRGIDTQNHSLLAMVDLAAVSPDRLFLIQEKGFNSLLASFEVLKPTS
jgi:hypothetical protein